MWHEWGGEVVNPAGKRSLEKPRRRWKGNNKMDVREIGMGGIDWINLALVNTEMNLRFQ
jgi:hypothetical protein